MCLIIDPGTYSSLFRADNDMYNDFSPIRELINKRKDKIIFGGKKYRKELLELQSFFGILKELDKKRSIRILNKDLVNSLQGDLKRKYYSRNKRFNDWHIVAIAIASECKVVICSINSRDYKYFTKTEFYPSGRKGKLYFKQNKKQLQMLDSIRKNNKCKSNCKRDSETYISFYEYIKG